MSPTRALRRVALAAAALALLAAGAPAPARAQSKADAFAGRIPPIAGQLYRKAGRLELTLGGNLSLNDAFFSKYFGAAKLGYHLTEHLSVGASFAAGTARATGSATVCDGQGCRPATEEQLWRVPGEIQSIAGVEAAWTPVYGKLNPFSAWVLHFDLGLLAGADWIRYREVIDPNVTSGGGDGEVAAGAPGTASTIGGHFGLGARIFFAEWVALRVEFKDYVYRAEVPSQNRKDNIESQLFTELGVSFFLPTRNRRPR